MLEDLAIRYINLGEALPAISYGLMIIGGVIAAIMWRGTGALRRAPYFAGTGIIVLLANASQLIWLDFETAITGQYLWTFVAIDLIALIAGGFAICVIAMARSRDAYGNGRMAALAFIPIANLWLLLTPSKGRLKPTIIPTVPLLTGGLGVLTGFVAVAVGVGLRSWIPTEIEKRASQWSSTDEGMAANNRIMIRQQGLEAVVQSLATELEVPIQIDEVTTIIATNAEGTTLRYIYKIDTQETRMREDFLLQLENYWCTYKPFTPVLRAGGAIAASYFNIDTKLIGEAKADAETCGLR